MKVLFVMRHSGYVRNFESTLRMLCERGHAVHLAFQTGTHWLLDPGDVTRELGQRYPRFSRGAIPGRDDGWDFVAREVRAGLDYLRYLAPEYRDATKLRGRATRGVPQGILRWTGRAPLTTAAGRALIARGLRGVDRAIPTDARLDAFLRAWRPDVLAVTPLIEPDAPQAEYLRSARALGIRTALCVASWDNLTNKGLIHGPVDLVAVWNEAMKQEAVTLHRIPAARVTVTGAQPFDHWFDWRPSTTIEVFTRGVGLPPGRPFILYLCSSKFIAPEEAPFVRRWLQQLRQSSSTALREAGVLVRPHPQHAEQWRGLDLGDCGPVVVWPPAGAAPSDALTRADYFDSMYHSAAVVGVNTTAEIESAIVGRPVFTILAPEFHDAHAGTLHFQHLGDAESGLVQVAHDFPEHLAQLEAALNNPPADDGRRRRFVEAFVRPFGVDVPATPKLVDALEALAAAPVVAAPRPPWWAPLARRALAARGERARRTELRLLETKAARQVLKRQAHDTTPAKRPPTWREIAAMYLALDEGDQRRFILLTRETMPGEMLIEGITPERLDYPDAEIYLRITSKDERNRLKACAKEPFTIEWIHHWVRPGEVLYDIGANVGAYSLVAAKKPGGGARVFAFEPSYSSVAALSANVVLNGVAGQVVPIAAALSDRTALDVLALRALDPGSARHVLGGASDVDGPAAYDQPVMTFRLDDLVDEFGLPAPDHIKLDVDGGELAVLAGAAKVLASASLQSMLVEVSTSLSDEITGVLTGMGLRLESKIHVQNRAGEYRVWYGLFVRQPHPERSDAGDVQIQYVSR